jgi:dephospho-CoA kinase
MTRSSLRVAVTGPIASGKSTALAAAKMSGYVTIDADEVYHDLLRTDRALERRLRRAFGDGVVFRGRINRRALRRLIADDPSQLPVLERITHPPVIRRINRLIRAAERRGAAVVAAIPLLFELGLERSFDAVVTLRCSRTAIMRRLKRRGIEPGEVAALVRRQGAITPKMRQSDVVIDTSALTARRFATIFRAVLAHLHARRSTGPGFPKREMDSCRGC